MRILIATTGSDGDVQPFFAFARHLLGLGHEVTFAGSGRYVARARALAVPFENLGESWDDDELQRRFARILAEPAPLKQLALVIDTVVEEETAWVPRLTSLAKSVDVVVYPPLLVAAVAAARAAGTRHASVHFAPMHRAMGYGPTGANLGAWLNVLGWKLAGAMLRRRTDAKLNTIVRAAGLAPWRDILLDASHATMLDLVAVSPRVLPKDAAWGAATRVTGYWFLDEPGFAPSPDLASFVTEGEAPVVIGFGSMTGLPADAITRTLLDAVDGLPRRVVLQSGWAGLGRAKLPDHVRAVGVVPHGWLFPRAACVVHHGGAGTTAAAFRAGVPQAVVWHLGDQPLWGAKVAQLGVGPRCVSHKKMTASWLRAQLDAMLSDAGMRARAAALGDEIRAEDGLTAASTALVDAMR